MNKRIPYIYLIQKAELPIIFKNTSIETDKFEGEDSSPMFTFEK